MLAFLRISAQITHMRTNSLTTRAERANARKKRERASGQLVPVNVTAVQDLLFGRQLATVSRQTGVPRRTLDHLRSGEVSRTRHIVLQRLATHFKRDIMALIGDPHQPANPTPPGEYASQARADMTLRRLWEAGVASVDDIGLRLHLERIHDLETGRRVLGAEGLPVWRLDGEPGWRPQRLNRRKLEKLKAEYADLVHRLFCVLLEASSREAGKGIKLARLTESLTALNRAADAPTPMDAAMQELLSKRGVLD